MNLQRLASTSDWISPMIVKELRQGLHSRLFVTFYLLLQGLLVLSALMMTSQGDSSAGDGLFWFTVGAIMMVALPARGLVAISLEVRAKTMELIYLTRLSSLRIILGKWGALFLQSVLCAVAVLPYLLVRYLLGGQEIVYELSILLIILLFSALCMALTVSFSALTNWWGRGAIALVAFSILYMTGAEVLYGSSVNDWLPSLVYLLITGSLLTAISLYYGASLIATSTDSHTAVLRVLCLVFTLVVPLAGLWSNDLISAGTITMAVLLLVTLSSLITQQEPITGNLRPFARMGPFGRWAAMLLSPGWASGLLYTLLLFLLIAASLYVASLFIPDLDLFTAMFLVVSLLGSILVPLALVLMFQSVESPRLLPFIWVQVSMLFATFFFQLLEQVLEAGTGWFGPLDLLALMPTATLCLFLSPDMLAPDEYLRFFILNCVVTFAAAAFLIYRARPELSELERMRQSFRDALRELKKTATPA